MAEKKPTDIEKVSELIDKYAGPHLDRYVIASVKNKAQEALADSKHTAQSVADAVFDFINDNHSGDPIMAAMCQQVCPKTILYILRNDIIAALK